MSKLTIREAEEKILNDGTDATLKRLIVKLSRQLNEKNSKEVLHANNIELDRILEDNEINNVCPHCGSRIIKKNGRAGSGLQQFRCKDCGRKFTRLTNTFIEGTRFSYDYWINLIQMEINTTSLKSIKENQIASNLTEFVSLPTVLNQRQKLMAATLHLMPSLSGIIEIDECHLREEQKGSPELISFLGKDEKRIARHRWKASKYGVRGNEYVCVVCAVDRNKNYYAFVSGFGTMKQEIFYDHVVPFIADAKILCSDANVIYIAYTNKYGIPHYVKPSNYDTFYKECKTDKDFTSYYHSQKLDYMLHSSKTNNMSYKQFKQYRDDNKLHINNVNEFHKDIKSYIEKNKTGVNIEYIKLYISWISYLKNIQKELGHRATSIKDAEYIFADLLKKSHHSTIKELKALDPVDMPRPSGKYMAILKKETEEARKKLNDAKFSFSDEDIGDSFSIRNQLEKLPVYILREIGKELKIKDHTKMKPGRTWKQINDMCRHPDIKKVLIDMKAKYPNKFNSVDNV